MSALREGIEELLHLLVEDGVMGDLRLEARQFVRSGQFAVEQQVGHLEEARFLSELLDRVAPIAEDAFLAVHVGDGALAPRRVGEAVVECHLAGRGTQLVDVDGGVADRAGYEIEVDLVPCNVQ
jgi:hypothetical protein